MLKNNDTFGVKEAKKINKILSNNFKTLNKLTDFDAIDSLHQEIVGFVINCEQFLVELDLSKLHKKINPNSQRLLNEYIVRWTNNAQVVYEKLSALEGEESMRTDLFKSLFFWFWKRRDYELTDSEKNDYTYSVYKPSSNRNYHYITQERNYTDDDLPVSASY